LDLVLLLGAGVIGLVLLGLFTVVRWLLQALSPVGPSAPPPLPPGRMDKLLVVEEVLGARMPDDLRNELDRLRGREPAGAASVALDAPTTAGDAAGSAPVARPQSPLAEPGPAAAWRESLLPFENVIFLLAACLILGGTLYVVATTSRRIPDRWQYLYAEAVIVFYGALLLVASAFVSRRAGLPAAARILAAIAAAISIGAGLTATAGSQENLLGGLLGAGVAANLAGLVAHMA
jgi:hypothetical protein